MSRETRMSRDARKQLLRLEAEMHRLELSASLSDLRQPFVAAQHGSWLLRLIQQPGDWMGMLSGLLASGKFAQVSRLLPLAMGAWKIARLFQQFLRRRRAKAD